MCECIRTEVATRCVYEACRFWATRRAKQKYGSCSRERESPTRVLCNSQTPWLIVIALSYANIESQQRNCINELILFTIQWYLRFFHNYRNFERGWTNSINRDRFDSRNSRSVSKYLCQSIETRFDAVSKILPYTSVPLIITQGPAGSDEGSVRVRKFVMAKWNLTLSIITTLPTTLRETMHE